jgi:hypothetical protein
VVSILEIKIFFEMTPKEKAENLYNRMLPKSGVVFKLQAKQCALVAVDEILSVLNGYAWSPTQDYWQEVKQEIEKL